MRRKDWKDMRTKWTSARDKLKVKSGAVKEVSIGDAIDKVYDDWKKGLLPLHKANRKLGDAIKLYKEGVSDKYPRIVNWLEENLEKSARDLDEAISDDIKYVMVFRREVTSFMQRPSSFSFPDGGEFVKVWAALKDPAEWKAKSAHLYRRLETSTNNFADFAATIRDCAEHITVAVPDSVQPEEFLEEAERIEIEVDLLRELIKTKDVGSEAFMDKARTCRDTYTILLYSLKTLDKQSESLLAENIKFRD